MPTLQSRYGPAPHVVGARIRAERQRLGLTILGCAEAVGVNRQTWLGYERGTDPRLSILVGLKEIGFDLRRIAPEVFDGQE